MTTSSTSALDDAYFAEYADPRTHKSMLLDDQRVLAYQRAINDALLAGKDVLDVGCGMTALLSILCARAGARKVYAVEACRDACRYARQVVRENGFRHVIEIIEGRVEDDHLLRALPTGDDDGYIRVDAIVSEWMGACLFHEGMLSSVLRARDRHLKPGGQMLPSGAALFLAPIEDRVTWDGQIGTWLYRKHETKEESNGDTIGINGRGIPGNIDINLECIVDRAKQSAFGHPWSRCLRPEQLLFSHLQPSPQPTVDVAVAVDAASVIGTWDLTTLPLEAVAHGRFLSRTSFRFGHASDIGRRTLHGFAIWFDVTFAPPATVSPTSIAASSRKRRASALSTLSPTITLSTGPGHLNNGLLKDQIETNIACDDDDTRRDFAADGNKCDASTIIGSGSDNGSNGENTNGIMFGGKATNHWGQTIFYIKDPHTFDKHSQQLHGVISIAPQLSPTQQQQQQNKNDNDTSSNGVDYSWRFLSVHLEWGIRNSDHRSSNGSGTSTDCGYGHGTINSGDQHGNVGIQQKREGTANFDSIDSYDYSATFTTAQIEYAEPCTIYPSNQSTATA